MEKMNSEIMLSVCCVTYNHEKFIAQAIEGFLMQKTTFKFEINIGEDCSTDKTREIAALYALKYPDKIHLVTSDSNLGGHKNFARTIKSTQGKYIAICEGDDYWTDPYKLQKQVDFLENNPDYVICCHYSRVIDEENQTLYVHPKPVSLEHSYEDLLIGKQEETKTASLVLRNIPEVQQLFTENWFFKAYAADKMLRLFSTFSTGKKIYVIPEVMSCYRNHQGGVWSMINPNARTNMMISDFNLIINNFKYTSFQKKRLLLLYIKRYFLFQLRNFQFNNAYFTIKSLL